MALVVVYVLFLLYVILRLFRRPARDAADYIVAGRRLTLPAFVATLVTTWYGGILGVGEYTWSYGISSWLVFGIPYYIYAALFAVLLAGRARRSRVLTVPDQLERHYGRPVALVGASVLFVMTVPAAYVLMLGVLVQFATGWPLWVGVVLGTLFSVGYVFRGGLRAIVSTDMVQFVLMFLAFMVLVPVCVEKYGGWSYLRESLPTGHLTWDGERGWQAVAVWYVIAMATLVEPAFYQRCFAARTERTARAGIGIAILFWIVFDFLTTTAGLYARALLPELTDPVTAFPALAATALTPFWQGVFLVGLLATIMSTVDSYAFISAVTVGRDIVQRWRAPKEGPGAGDEATLPAIRWSLLLTAVLSVALALWAGSVVRIWHDLGSIGTPMLLLPLALSYTSISLSGRTVLLAMVLAGGVSMVWLAAGAGKPFLGVEAIFPGLGVSAAMILAALVSEKPPGKSNRRRREG
jgi:SSS family solute:Na+ symporter